MKKSIVFFVFLTAFACSFSQSTISSAEKSLQQKKLDELQGTYSLRSTSRTRSTLPSDLADIIVRNRKENVINRIKLNEDIELIIYPANDILNNGQKIKQ